jgi:hypothetical protein
MEGERAFVQDLAADTPLAKAHQDLLADNLSIAYRYSLGGGVKESAGWEPLGPAGLYDTFGPELSFAATLAEMPGDIAIAKFTHSGSQIIDWTPEGSEAVSRNLYPDFIAFIKDTIADLEQRGHTVSLEGIFYHVGENDMSWGPFRSGAAKRVMSLVNASRVDLDRPALRWTISQQAPTDDPSVNTIDVTRRDHLAWRAARRECPAGEMMPLAYRVVASLNPKASFNTGANTSACRMKPRSLACEPSVAPSLSSP